MTSLMDVIEEARAKHIEVLIGEPQTEQEIEAVAAELGVKFPADYRRVLTTVGALSFRKDSLHYFAYGKPSAETEAAGVSLDLLEAGRQFLAHPLASPDDPGAIAAVPVAGKIDLDHGHAELTLVDADGAYRSLFEGGSVSEPRLLLDVEGIFAFFVSMFDRDGNRRDPTDMLASMGITFD